MHASCVVHFVGHEDCKLSPDQKNEWVDASGTLEPLLNASVLLSRSLSCSLCIQFIIKALVD